MAPLPLTFQSARQFPLHFCIKLCALLCVELGTWGLRKMRELTEKLPNFLQGKEPQYQTEATSFYTTFYNLNWNENGRIPVEEVANRVNSTLEKYPVNEECSVEKFGVNAEKFGVNEKDSHKQHECSG